MTGLVWIDGALQPREAPALRADDSAYAEGRGCYTTARWVAGKPRFEERHVARLVRAVRELDIGVLEPDRVRAALRELGAAEFGDREGVVRISASRDGDGTLHLVGVPRPVGDEPATWSAAIVGIRHDAPGQESGLKVTSRLAMALAGDSARELGVDEALLLDTDGNLVEGARSNIVVVVSGRPPATPPISAGGVAGVARGVALERVSELEERTLTEAELRDASEIVAVNAVRGACPIVRLDGAPVGNGEAGPWAERLLAALTRD